jgi:hypothetical protein
MSRSYGPRNPRLLAKLTGDNENLHDASSRYMPDGTVILRLYKRRSDGRARHLRVSLPQWLVGRGVYLLDSHASRQAQARQLNRRCG